MRFGVGPRKNADGDEVEASHRYRSHEASKMSSTCDMQAQSLERADLAAPCSPHSKGMDKGKAKINLKTSFIEARDW